MDYGELIELLIRALPYPDQMRRIEFANDYVEFDWRGVRYRFSSGGSVDEVRGSCLASSNSTILMQSLVQLIRAYDAANKARKVAA